MAHAVFRDKIGGTTEVSVRAGQSLAEALRANGVPVNAVISYKNGKLVCEDSAVVEPDDFLEFHQVRHYDLDVTRAPARRVYSALDPVYTKSVLFDEGGDVEIRSEQFGEAEFYRYVERTFVESVNQSNLISAGDRLLTGLSGGRDSVAYLKLMERTQEVLPDYTMVAATITGLPDWEEPETFTAAIESCRMLGIEHVVIDAQAIEELFHLTKPYVEIMTSVIAGRARGLNMVLSHQVLRRLLEVEAVRQGATKVVLGLNADDLVASLVMWFTTGFRIGGLPRRRIGELEYIYPLHHITKKELTLYLEITAPSLNRQGAPGRFTTGPGERSLAYAVADHLYDLWPGIDYYLIEAQAHVQQSLVPADEGKCRVCGGTYLLQEGVPNPADLCDVCGYFVRNEYARI
jgi:hypothetical protein